MIFEFLMLDLRSGFYIHISARAFHFRVAMAGRFDSLNRYISPFVNHKFILKNLEKIEF